MNSPVTITRLRKREFNSLVRDLSERKPGLRFEEQLPLNHLPARIGKNVITDPDVPVPECITCGACCEYALVVPVSSRDAEFDGYVSVIADDWDEDIEVNRVLPRDPETCRCSYLEGTIGERIGCRIYERRPNACRNFDAGSDRCHEYRRMYGLESQLGTEAVAEAFEKLNELVPLPKIEYVAIVPASKISSVSFGPGGVECVESTLLKIFAYTGDETPYELHSFDPANEFWLENDLLGYTLDEARAAIAARTSG